MSGSEIDQMYVLFNVFLADNCYFFMLSQTIRLSQRDDYRFYLQWTIKI